MVRFASLILCIFLSFSAYAADISLSSNAFAEGIPLPVLYTCDGKDISPDLSWSTLPPKTLSTTIIFSDEDAPGGIFYHWVLYNIPVNTKELAQGITTLPSGTLVGKNSWGKTQYNGPCPPKGMLHHYTFTLYALDKKLLLSTDADALALLKSMQGHIIKKATLKAVYARWPT